ncbi:MAG: hypothetical protein V4555_17215, partial [Acidobacteriota bacterium]
TLPTPRKSIFSGTADATQTAYFETVQATLWNAIDEDPPLTFDLYAGFCDSLEHVGLGLLGQHGFFTRFEVNFKLSANILSIK